MPTTTYTCYVGNSNKDLTKGTTFNEYFTRDGDAIPAGATITGASLSISSLRVYSQKGPYLSLGTLGTTAALTYNENVHSETVSFTPGTGLGSFSSGSVPITIYSTQSTSGNMLNLRDGCVLTLSITYQETSSASTGSLSKSSVEIGSGISLYIYSDKTTNWHITTWTLGSYIWHQEVPASGTISSFILPESWADAITGSSATGRVSLSTYNSSDTFIGSNSYTFTVMLPASTAPTIGGFTASRIDGDVPPAWGVYVQGKSKALLTITGAAGTSGSTIATYKFAGGGYSWSSFADTSYTTGFLMQSGETAFTGTVTDSRGYSASKTATITVMPYEPPSITSVTVYRCLQNGTASETGAYFNVRCDATFSSVGGKNTLAMSVAVRRVGTTAWSNAVALINGQATTFSASLTGTNLYEIRILATDTFGAAERITDIAAAQYTMFFPNGGLNVSFGKAGTRQNAVEINPDWKLYHGDTDLIAKINGSGGVTPIANGGTGATTSADALTNLGAAPASHNHSTDNLTSGTLPVARGGTGTTSLTASRVLVSSATGTVTTASTTATQLGYLANVTSDIQSQLNGKTSIKVQYGSTWVDGTTAATIYFSGFSYAPYVTATYSTTGTNWSGDNGAIKIYNKSASSANIIVGGTFPTSRQIDWIAVGI